MPAAPQALPSTPRRPRLSPQVGSVLRDSKRPTSALERVPGGQGLRPESLAQGVALRVRWGLLLLEDSWVWTQRGSGVYSPSCTWEDGAEADTCMVLSGNISPLEANSAAFAGGCNLASFIQERGGAGLEPSLLLPHPLLNRKEILKHSQSKA